MLTTGVTNYCLPMTTGNGSMMLNQIIQFGYKGEISTNLLLASGFARTAILTISMNSGFVGGFIYPIITLGVISAMICYQQFPYLPVGLCLTCFCAALPAGIVPMPYTLTCLSCFVFSLNSYQTAPVFIATMTSYVIVSGSGFFGALQARAREMEEAKLKEQEYRLTHGAEGDFDEDEEKDHVPSRITGNKTTEDALSLAKYLDLNRPK
jgi:H+/Cl- antiporter ClcA